jgi:hypothetical protein
LLGAAEAVGDKPDILRPLEALDRTLVAFGCEVFN